MRTPSAARALLVATLLVEFPLPCLLRAAMIAHVLRHSPAI